MEYLTKIESKPKNIRFSNEVRFPIVVCSHERSGTHFLMNSLAQCTQYSAEPFLNFDHDPFGDVVDFYSQSSILEFFELISNFMIKDEAFCVSELIKSHHFPWHFEKIFASTARIAYVYRNPVDVFVSYWKFLHKWNWLESIPQFPRTPYELCISKPGGKSLRYQVESYDTFFDRWANHVSGWLHISELTPMVYPVSYSGLIHHHQRTLNDLCSQFSIDILNDIQMPSKWVGVIPGSDLTLANSDKEELAHYCRERLIEYPKLLTLFINDIK